MHLFPSLGNRCNISGKSVQFFGKSVQFSGKSVHQTGDNPLNNNKLIFLLLYYYITILPERGFFKRKIPSFFFPKVEERPPIYPVSSDEK